MLNQPPVPKPGAFQLNVETLGRLIDPRQFGNIIVKTDPERPRDAHPRHRPASSSAPQDYGANGYLDERAGGAAADLPAPGLERAGDRRAHPGDDARAGAQSSRRGLQYDIVYNPTEFIAESVHEVIKTIFEAVVLVVIVVILFLQTWRASIIPIVAIPVSLIGTFAVLAAFGFSLNNLSLFGLVLAIGIVVDDAIVVVENVERNLRSGHEPARGGAPDHGRGRRRAHRDRAGALGGVHSGGVHPRHLRPVLPPVRGDHRLGDGDLLPSSR